MMERDPRIVAIGQSLCAGCKKKIEGYYVRNPKVTFAGMTVFVLRTCCRKCQQQVLQGTARMGGRT